MLITLTSDPQQPQPSVCTLGMLDVAGRKFHTIELPWIPSLDGPAGLEDRSCIGAGTYRLEARETDARGKHFLIYNASLGVYRFPADIKSGQYGRCLVLIHAANWAHELLGCIAPGKHRLAPNAAGNPYSEWMVTDSKNALNEIRTLLGTGYDHQLQIIRGA